MLLPAVRIAEQARKLLIQKYLTEFIGDLYKVNHWEMLPKRPRVCSGIANLRWRRRHNHPNINILIKLCLIRQRYHSRCKGPVV